MPFEAKWCPTEVTFTTRDGSPARNRSSSRSVRAKWPTWLTPSVYSMPCAVSWRADHVPPALLTRTSRRSQRRQHLVGRLADRCEVGQVERDGVHVVVPGPLDDLPGGRLGLGLVTAGQHCRRPLGRHAHRRLEADARVGPGDDDDLALHAHGDPIRVRVRVIQVLSRHRPARHAGRRAPLGLPATTCVAFGLPTATARTRQRSVAPRHGGVPLRAEGGQQSAPRRTR